MTFSARSQETRGGVKVGVGEVEAEAKSSLAERRILLSCHWETSAGLQILVMGPGGKVSTETRSKLPGLVQ